MFHSAFPKPLALLVFSVVLITEPSRARGDELYIGAATVSITPSLPVALTGQMHTRIARNVESEVTATALAVESRRGDQVMDQAIMVSCDLVAIREGILDSVRRRMESQVPDFDSQKLFLSATHTHTAPVMTEGRYALSKAEVTEPAEYVDFLCDRVAEAASRAWNDRQPGRVGWAMSHAVVAQNRRSVYVGGRAQMYGKTDVDDFRRFEGYEDHGIDVLFFWDHDARLVATAINVACPAQEVESRKAVNADFWHEVRHSLRQQVSDDLHVLGWTGASGDQSPHLMFRRRAEERMRQLRGLSRLQEISRRVVRAWNEAYEGAKQDMRSDVPLVHDVQQIQLPTRQVTDAELAHARSQIESLSGDPNNRWRIRWEQSVVDRYAEQQSETAKSYSMELHTIRLGDIAIVTNDFELFTEFGVQIKARSKALQTFVIQLAGPGTYVPSAGAVKGGGYSAIIESSHVGPRGGQVLVDRTVESINQLWD